MSTRYKRTDWVRRLDDYSSGSSSGFALGRGLMAGLLATVPVASTTGAGSLKSSAWREKWGLSPIFVAIFVIDLTSTFTYGGKPETKKELDGIVERSGGIFGE